ncbi:MAG: glycerate kinase [Actinomycetota bacterium]|nr:glycerate kinase [Actinomycetota bacterium]
MRVVLAPDKFKGALTAAQGAAAVGAGLRQSRPDVTLTLLPVADGGDGTVDAALSAGYTRVRVEAVGPTGRPVATSYAVRGGQAVIELANVVGLDLLPAGGPDPMGASTYGLGLVIRHALDRGAQRIALGVGGSASTDGGLGMLQALGASVLDHTGGELGSGGGALSSVAAMRLDGLHRRLGEVEILVACDVDNPLLGPRGAARVFGPQKGADPEQVGRLEYGLDRWAGVVRDATGHDCAAVSGAGAAGGTAFAAMALMGAQVRSGIGLVLELVGFAAALPGADLVVTGEGSLDEQSLAGKAPVGVARAATEAGVPVVAVAGRCLLSPTRLRDAGIRAAYPLSDLEPDVARSMAGAPGLLTRLGLRIAGEWLR